MFYVQRTITASLIILNISFFNNIAAQETIVKDSPTITLRAPQYPLKTSRTFWTEDEIANAQRLVQSDARAKAVLTQLKEQAAFWVNKSDERILELIPPASVPRAFNVSVYGDPIHGEKLYEYGTYPWKLDPERPYIVISPIDGAEYPSNNFAEDLKNGFDTADGSTTYFDDGWGWVSPDGRRYWFVAYATHWHWRKQILPGLLAASRVYVLTGEKQYGHVAALMLAAVAEQYPAMNYNKQSRYGALQPNYQGKILNAIWETFTLRQLAEAYDNIWINIDTDRDLQSLLQKDGEAIRALIEANILEEGIDAVRKQHIRGNFGMHQAALMTATLVRQHAPTTEILYNVLKSTGGPFAHEGLDYALYNFVHRDGLSFEGAPGYNRLWVDNFFMLAKRLNQLGISDPNNLAKLRNMAMAPLQMIVLNWTTPAIGDSGSITSGIVAPNNGVYRLAAQWYGDPLFKWWNQHNNTRVLKEYDQLFATKTTQNEPSVELDLIKQPTTRILDGYGLAILENNTRDWGLSLYYGLRGTHGHRDGLNFELYGFNRKLTPDTGYPDFMNSYVPGIFSWSKNTIAHNTVMIDRKQQDGRGPAQMTYQFEIDGVRAIEVDANDLFYKQTDMYRRALIMVETGDETGYVIDVMRVKGGSEHHYSLHGPPGEVHMLKGEWSKPWQGTFAGTDIGIGELYDAPKMNTPDYKGTYHAYLGSGFSHFQNVQELLSRQPILIYRHQSDPTVGVGIHLTHSNGDTHDQTFTAESQVSPLKQKDMLRYLIQRRHNKETLSSSFISVLEPFRGKPKVQSVKRREIEGGVVIEVVRDNGREIILYRYQPNACLKYDEIETDGKVTIAFYQTDNTHIRKIVLLGGTRATVRNQKLRHGDSDAFISAVSANGKVVSIDPPNQLVTIETTGDGNALLFSGRYLRFDDGGRIVRHLVSDVSQRGREIRLLLNDEMRIARGRIASTTEDTLTTTSRLNFFENLYSDAWLTDDQFSTFTRIDHVSKNVLRLSNPLPHDVFIPGRDFWICTIRPGSNVILEASTSWHNP